MPATFACAYYTSACDTLVPQALVNIRLERESPRLSCLDCGVAADLLAHGKDGGQIEVHREVPVGALEVDEHTVLGLEDPGNHKFSRIAARNRIRSEFIPIDSDGVQLDRLAPESGSSAHT